MSNIICWEYGEILIVPGTTISLTLMPTYVEVRDKGVIKKKIPLKDRSFEDVALELTKYFRYLGKRLAPGVMQDVLERIGLPKARRVISEPEPEPEPAIEVPPEPEPIKEPPKKKKGKKEKKKKEDKKKKQAKESPGTSAHEHGVISADDYDDIADALQAVEALSDSFMAPSGKEKIQKKKKQKISINLEGKEEIVASGTTYVRTPEAESAITEIEESASEIIELVAVTIEEDSTPETEPLPTVTPTHQIKPVVQCKALLLGESGVGKKTLKEKVGAEASIINEETGKVSTYIHRKIIDGSNYRIELDVWSFDLAVKAKLPRQKFYDDAQLLVIIYAASDRWSFESLDFWLRESSITCKVTPPVVIVGNKIDLRSETEDDSGEDPVSYNEGFQYAEELAKRLGSDDNLHPVAFIETSSLTGVNTEEVFKTAADLFENTL
ncbi:MAG: hypothetical protein ACTSYJ_10575 [Candidatus Thorarchaeota archaeon]